MKIILTGSAGFIGRHLKEALEDKGHQVFGIDKKINVNIADGNKLANHIETFIPDPEMIIHLAANCSTQRGLDHPDQDFQDNVVGTFNILETAKYFGIPIIYASTCKVIPNHEGIRTPYGLSKFVGEEYIREYSECYGIEFIANRMGTIYGPGQEGSPESGWLAWFIKAKLEKLPLTVFGDGKQIRDVLYIDDLVELYLDQVENFEMYANQVYEVGGGDFNAISLNQALEYLGITKYKTAPPRTGDAKSYIANLVKVNKVNKWNAKTSWKTGIEKTLNYYK